MMAQEFYDQRKWKEIHKQADQLIATKNGDIIAAVYKSPIEKTREDQQDFAEMLQNWASNLEWKPPQ